MFKKLAGLFRKQERDFEAFHIEVSTYSSRECRVCPRDIFGERWLFRNMAIETFAAIARHFPLTQWVSFHGWGDPLENGHLGAMIRQARAAGCMAGLSTNGALLDERRSDELIASGLDLIVVSLETATHELTRALAPGSDPRMILDRVEGLIRLRSAGGGMTPRVKLSVPMTRMNIRDLPGLVPLAAEIGVDELIFHNLDYLPDEQCNILRAFYHESPTAAFEESLAEVRRLAREWGLPVEIAPLRLEEKPVCSFHPHRRVFFSTGGAIAPCPLLMIPKQGDIRRIFVNEEVRVPQTFFGNIREQDLPSVWNSQPCRAFRRIFEQRIEAAEKAVQMLDLLSGGSRAAMFEELTRPDPPPLPEPCRSCYKAFGI